MANRLRPQHLMMVMAPFACLWAACGGEPLSGTSWSTEETALVLPAGAHPATAIEVSFASLTASSGNQLRKPRPIPSGWLPELGTQAGGGFTAPTPPASEPDPDPVPGSDPDPEVPRGPVCEALTGGTCYYVDAHGSDAAAGSFEAPFLTFRAAFEQVEPGDVIYARGGTYDADNAMTSGVEAARAAASQASCLGDETFALGACYRDERAMIAIQSFSGWASRSGAYDVPSGTAERPIVVRGYPGEQAVLDVGAFSTTAVEIRGRAHWTIEGFEIVGGMINLEGETNQQTHDIMIRGNDIHDLVIDGGDNPGLVRVDRGDSGGAHDIFIHDNQLHGISDWESPGAWMDAVDRQHFGAVTTLSRQEYYGFDGGGTGYIEIVGNVMYDLPQVFFFKNPMAGPTEIRDNVIYDAYTLGNMTGANMHFHRNLVFRVPFGFERIGGRTYSDPRMLTISGTNAVIEYNTFVGMDSLMSMRWGTGHRVEHNVFFGMDTTASGAGFDTPSYIAKHEVAPDPLAVEASALQSVISDHNCFFSANPNFQAVARYLPPDVTGAGWRLEHFDLAQAATLFGFDANSRLYVEDDAAQVFVAPDLDDYELRDPTQCPDMGWNAP